jgi:glycosyltransferase involved in cell wall biosynthesis
MRQPRITIVTPSYNQAPFLEQTIHSVLQQRDEIHEYFVLDGGSTDGSAEIIAKYAGDIDYWVSQEDAGQGDAIRRGFERATGDVLGWINSDDLLLPGAAAAVRRRFAARPELQAVTGHFCLIDAEGRLLRYMWIPSVQRGWVYWGVMRICQPSTFFRRDFYEAVGGLDTRWKCVLDVDLWCRMLRQRCNWQVLPQYLAARRYHADMKGYILMDHYRHEHQELARLYPEFRAKGLRRAMGQWAFRGYQCCHPQFWRSTLDTLRNRNRSLPWRCGK